MHVDDFGLQIRHIRIIKVELALQGAVRYPTAPL
jgi:hypothetical protein